MNVETLAARRTNRVMQLIFAALLVVAVVATTGAHAEEHRGDRNREQVRFDGRFNHNQYYHPRGYDVVAVPRGAYEVRHGGQSYWYHGGEWYRHGGRGLIVVGAPLGAFVPVLPPLYSTVWWGGVPYYYADDTYYEWNGGLRQYQVVEAPPGIESGGSTVAPASDEVFIYPRNGQSSEQQATDRYECHRFAVSQTGFDNTLAGGGVPADIASSKRADYQRAQAACLEGRGYSVK